MMCSRQLRSDLQKQVRQLEDDLRRRAGENPDVGAPLKNDEMDSRRQSADGKARTEARRHRGSDMEIKDETGCRYAVRAVIRLDPNHANAQNPSLCLCVSVREPEFRMSASLR